MIEYCFLSVSTRHNNTRYRTNPCARHVGRPIIGYVATNGTDSRKLSDMYGRGCRPFSVPIGFCIYALRRIRYRIIEMFAPSVALVATARNPYDLSASRKQKYLVKKYTKYSSCVNIAYIYVTNYYRVRLASSEYSTILTDANRRIYRNGRRFRFYRIY